MTFRYEEMEMLFSLGVDEGECLAIIGPSGSGKSTLLNLIAGFDHPLSGDIFIKGRNVTRLPPQERQIAILFQDNNLFPHLTVWQNVALALKETKERESLVVDALAKVGLDHAAKRLPGELSGGERQRVALARSLLTHSPLLLLDEPFNALGPALKQDVLALTNRLRRDNGLTVLFVTHDPQDVYRLGDKAAFLHGGKIVTIGTPREVLASAHPLIRGYLGSL